MLNDWSIASLFVGSEVLRGMEPPGTFNGRIVILQIELKNS